MSDEKDDNLAEERRSMPRYPSRADAVIIRENDAMRTGINGQLTDVSVNGLGVQLPSSLNVGEEVRLELSNPTQRIKKNVRGIVRHCAEDDRGTFRLGIELQSRLTPPEVQMLRTNRPDSAGDDNATWV